LRYLAKTSYLCRPQLIEDELAIEIGPLGPVEKNSALNFKKVVEGWSVQPSEFEANNCKIPQLYSFPGWHDLNPFCPTFLTDG
jgi:hypothetical protein